MEGRQNVAKDANVHACAACKHQRKRCDSDVCPLAPYFPANKSEEFRNVHRIYGVNNLIRILHSVPEHLRHRTAETLVLEAAMRKEFPVSGSLAVQAQTRVLIHEYEKELEFVKKQIAFFKEMKRVIPHTYNHIYGSCLQPPPTTVESTIDPWRMEGDGPLEDAQSFMASGKVFVDAPFVFLFKCICVLLDIEFEFNPMIGSCIVLAIIRRRVDRANAAPNAEHRPPATNEGNEHKCNLPQFGTA
ncbi:hypothetical protein RHGRI_013027 [Rhododendron griersonianum]|uniref:LOB domain-containing protein n=1 Tax=Rhododendron griersonianum TaxID=479676 RepID=A0AAV6K4G1_9ERIC|nr:hypothetical protein RHGRI_013027 [Rhododendron griersonianum]